MPNPSHHYIPMMILRKMSSLCPASDRSTNPSPTQPQQYPFQLSIMNESAGHNRTTAPAMELMEMVMKETHCCHLRLHQIPSMIRQLQHLQPHQHQPHRQTIIVRQVERLEYCQEFSATQLDVRITIAKIDISHHQRRLVRAWMSLIHRRARNTWSAI